LHTIHTTEYSENILGFFGEIFSKKRIQTQLTAILQESSSSSSTNRFHQLSQELLGSVAAVPDLDDLMLYPDRRRIPVAENLLEVDTLHGMWFLKTKWLSHYLTQVWRGSGVIDSNLNQMIENLNRVPGVCLSFLSACCGRYSLVSILEIFWWDQKVFESTSLRTLTHWQFSSYVVPCLYEDSSTWGDISSTGYSSPSLLQDMLRPATIQVSTSYAQQLL
jgi:hypothetical protein